MNSVLISIKPKWCEKIANGEKTIEIRKTVPKIGTPFRCYIYCTAPKKFYKISERMATSAEYLHLCDGKVTMSDGFEFFGRTDYKVLNRKIIGEFVCDRIMRHCEMANADIAEQQGCIRREDILEYAGYGEAYGWHISDLQIYDEPKELSAFGISRPPQSWMYVHKPKGEQE